MVEGLSTWVIVPHFEGKAAASPPLRFGNGCFHEHSCEAETPMGWVYEKIMDVEHGSGCKSSNILKRSEQSGRYAVHFCNEDKGCGVVSEHADKLLGIFVRKRITSSHLVANITVGEITDSVTVRGEGKIARDNAKAVRIHD
jgi:hypothetical protein